MRIWIMYFLGLTAWSLSAAETVENGIKPINPLEVIFVEDLRITSEDGDDHFVWAGNDTTVAVDERGHMFVLDAKEYRIIELDPDGNFIRQFGGKGDGPTEYRGLNSFQIMADGTGLAFESAGPSSYITTYDKQMNFLDKKEVRIPGKGYRRLEFADHGELLGGTVTRTDVERGVEITEFLIADKNFQEKKQLLYWESPMLNQAKITEPQEWVDFLAGRFHSMSKGNIAYVAFAGKDRFYTATSNAYEVTVWNGDLTEKMKIVKKYKPISQSEAEVEAIVEPIRDSLLSQLPEALIPVVTENVIRRAVKKAEFPPAKFPIVGLNIMGEYLLVIHARNFSTLVVSADIFDQQGKYRGSFSMPGNSLQFMVFKKGYAYAVETVDDELELVRYKYSVVPKS